jgi:hypothetical protein
MTAPATPAPKWHPFAVGGLVALGLASLRFFEREVTFLIPACPLHAFTGLHCPGCGATRATKALLHGDLAAAWHYNQLFIILLPLLGLFFAQAIYLERPFRGSPRIAVTLIAIAVIFGILRNIPVAPFTALAPH